MAEKDNPGVIVPPPLIWALFVAAGAGLNLTRPLPFLPAARFDNLWLVILLAAWFPAMHYGVIAREERYLEAKFGGAYTGYKARVRRWI